MPKKTDQIIEPIDASFDDVAGVVIRGSGTTKNTIKNKAKDAEFPVLGTTPIQQSLFHVERQVEFNDIEMGVLESGVDFLCREFICQMKLKALGCLKRHVQQSKR